MEQSVQYNARKIMRNRKSIIQGRKNDIRGNTLQAVQMKSVSST